VLETVSQKLQWDDYWEQQNAPSRVYSRIASYYRRVIIAPSVRKTVRKHLSAQKTVLHAGSGGGEIDALMPEDWQLFSIDFSTEAIQRHQSQQKLIDRSLIVLQGDLFALPFHGGHFDVVFNLGVMEHFSEDEVARALSEMKRVLKPQGRVILYWPPIWGPTVVVLHSVAWLLRVTGRYTKQLHPAEINLFRSKRQCKALLAQAGLKAVSINYGPQDLFTHVIIIAEHDE